jgi:hypothetical protein
MYLSPENDTFPKPELVIEMAVTKIALTFKKMRNYNVLEYEARYLPMISK